MSSRECALVLLVVVSSALGVSACSAGTTPAPAHNSSTKTDAPSPTRTDTQATSLSSAAVAGVGRIKHVLSPGGYLDGIAETNGTLWVADLDGDRVVRIDVPSLRQLPDIAIPDGPLTVVAHSGAVWVASYNGDTVTRLDAGTGAKTATVTTPSQSPCGLAAAGKTLWIFDQSDGAGVLVDATTGKVLRKVRTAAHSGLAATAYGSVWVPDFTGTTGAVQRLDASTGAHQATIKTGQGPIMVASGAGSVWVANAKADTVTRLDPSSGRIQAQIPLPGAAPVSVLVTSAGAWVAGYSSNSLYRVDLATNKVVGRLALPGPAENMVVAGGLLWVTTASGQLVAVAMAP